MNVEIRKATKENIPEIVILMREFAEIRET